MERILERYDRYSYAERQLVATDTATQGSWNLEHAKLKARIEVLESNHRHCMGEDLDSLSLKELQTLENQLDSAVKHIRSKKNQLMFESISHLQKKDKALQEQNKLLAKKIKEKEKEKEELAQQPAWEVPQNHGSSSFAFSQPFIGDVYQAGGDGQFEETAQQQNQANTILPAWMLRHTNG